MYDLIELIAALRQRKKPNMFLWNLLVRKSNFRKKAKFEIHMKKANREMAPFVGKYINGTVMKKYGAEVKYFEPADIKPVRRAHANELLEQQFGQTIYGQSIDPEAEALNKVGEELRELDLNICRRENWMLSKMLTTGVVPIVGEAIDTAFDYQCSADNFQVLTSGSLFSDADVDAYEWIKSEQLRILKETGVLVDSIVLEPTASAAFMNNESIKEHYKYNNADVVRIEPKNLGDGAAFLGTLPELTIDIYTFIDWVEDPETEETTQLLTEGGMLMVKSQSVEVDYGAVAQIPFGEKHRQIFIGDRVPKHFVEDDNELIRLTAKPITIPDDVDGWSFTIIC